MAPLLFIAPKDLGEAVLATGALAHLLRESEGVVIVCSGDAAPLFRGVPGLEAMQVRPEGPSGAWAAWLKLPKRRFEILLDAEGGLLGRAVRTRRRVALAPASTVRRRTEEWAAAVGADRALEPHLWLDARARAAAAKIAPASAPVLLLAPGGVTPSKRWPPERFAAVARRLASGALSGASIVVLGAARRDVEITSAIVSSLDADGVAALDLGSGLDLLAAAALMERATLCIGNDNALTHIAAAMGAPTLTLFGPTDERVRAPHGPRARTLRGRSFEEVAALGDLDASRAMEDVSIDAVEAAALDLLHAGGLR